MLHAASFVKKQLYLKLQRNFQGTRGNLQQDLSSTSRSTCPLQKEVAAYVFQLLIATTVLALHSWISSHSDGGEDVEPASSTAAGSDSKAPLGSRGQDECDQVVWRQPSGPVVK